MKNAFNDRFVMNTQNLSVKTSKGECILQSVDLRFDKGVLHGVFGNSGSGKTTLCKALCGLTPCKVDGTIHMNHKVLSKYERRSSFAFIPTQPQLPLEWTPRQLFHFFRTLSSSHASDQSGHVSITKDLSGRVDTIEKLGLTTLLDRRILFLSTGQKKRVQLVCELFFQPNVLCFDEPTTGMSDHDALEFMRLLREWVEDTAECVSITVIHQPRKEVYEMFHKFLLIEKGQVLAYSTVDLVHTHMQSLFETRCEEQDQLTFIMDHVHLLTDEQKSECQRKLKIDGYEEDESNVILQTSSPCWKSQLRAFFIFEKRFAVVHFVEILILIPVLISGAVLVEIGNHSDDPMSLSFKMILTYLMLCNGGVSFLREIVYDQYLYIVMTNLLCRSCSPILSVIPRSLFALLSSMFTMMCATPVLLWIYGITITFNTTWSLFLLSTLVMATFAEIRGALIFMATGYGHNITGLICGMAVMAFSGVYTEPSELPSYSAWLCYCNPLFYAIQAFIPLVDDEFVPIIGNFYENVICMICAWCVGMLIHMTAAWWRRYFIHPSMRL